MIIDKDSITILHQGDIIFHYPHFEHLSPDISNSIFYKIDDMKGSYTDLVTKKVMMDNTTEFVLSEILSPSLQPIISERKIIPKPEIHTYNQLLDNKWYIYQSP